MNRKAILRPFVILFAAGLVILLNGCTQTSKTYGVVGRPAISDDGQYVTVLVAESNGITRQVNGGYRSTTYNTSYWLKVYETGTGKLVKKKKILSDAEDQRILPLCYGGYKDKIWLHTTQLTACSITSLEELVNEEQLLTNNAFNKKEFPDEERFINEAVADGYIDFRANSGRIYRINLSSLKISDEKDAVTNKAAAIIQQNRLMNELRPTYGVRCDTVNGKMYILAANSSTAINSNPGNCDNEPIYRKMYLFTSSYTLSSYNNHHFFKNSNLQQLSEINYLNPVFLKDFATGKVACLQKPGLYIILHNDSLSNNARSILTAIDDHNNTIWQVNTGLSTKLACCIVKNNYAIITGNKNSLIVPHTGSDMLCVVNMQTGKFVSPPVSE
jgi:hypothetical protein